MGALTSALGLATGGGSKLAPNPSSANTSPQNSTLGASLLNFGGINLGNQDIPLNAATTSATNQPSTLGNTPVTNATVVSTLAAYLPYILLVGAIYALYKFAKK